MGTVPYVGLQILMLVLTCKKNFTHGRVRARGLLLPVYTFRRESVVIFVSSSAYAVNLVEFTLLAVDDSSAQGKFLVWAASASFDA